MSRWLPLVLLVGCGPKLAPLDSLRAEVTAARRAGGQGPAHVRVALSRPATERLIRTAMGTSKPLVFPLMMGTVAKVSPTLEPLSLSIARSPVCNCPRATLEVNGSVDVAISGLLGNTKLADDLGFHASARGTARLSIDRAGKKGGKVIALEPVKRDPWQVDIRLAHAEGFLTDTLVANQVTAPIAQVLSKPIPLFTIPADSPIQPAKVKLEVAEDPLGAVWLVAAPGDEVRPPTPRKGWEIATNEINALAGMRAAVSGFKQHKNWKIEPTNLTVERESFTAHIRVHKVARKAKYRDYQIDGTLTFGETIEITPTSVVETAKKGWVFSFIGPFVKGRVRKQVFAADVSLPASIERNIGQTPTTWTVQGLRSRGSRIVIYGSVK